MHRSGGCRTIEAYAPPRHSRPPFLPFDSSRIRGTRSSKILSEIEEWSPLFASLRAATALVVKSNAPPKALSAIEGSEVEGRTLYTVRMILDAILHRRSCRTFKPDPVPPSLIEELIRAGQFAPAAHHIKSIEYVVVTDPVIRKAIADVLVPQEFVAKAPVVIVPVADTRIASKPREDLCLATANIWLQATHLRLGCVWKHVHDGEEQVKLRAVLGIPEHFLFINVLPIGFPAEGIAPHTDEEFDLKRVHKEKW